MKKSIDYEKYYPQEPDPKIGKVGKTSFATSALLEDWEPTKATCPKCNSSHVEINKMCVLTTYPEQYQYKCADCAHNWTGFKAQSLGPIQSWPSLEIEKPEYMGNMGWICPKCGGVFAPHMNYCTNCTPPLPINITYADLQKMIPPSEISTNAKIIIANQEEKKNGK